jgi:hypothetical protein
MQTVGMLGYMTESFESRKPPPNEERLSRDLAWADEHPEILNDTLNGIRDYITHLSSSRGVPSEESIELRGERLKPRLLSELCQMFLESERRDWLAQPAYYAAIVEEIETRSFEIRGRKKG